MNPNPENNTYEGSKPYKLRYKGIENFLRRVAFNLGNTPSQTEVKIISCIPIDVTDLQNKILNLEKQLHEARNSKGSTKNVPVHTALINSTLPNTETDLNCKCSEVTQLVFENDKKMTLLCGDESSKARKSVVSFLFPSWSATGSLENKPLAATKKEAAKEAPKTNNDEPHNNFFRRGKKKHPKTQMVYYAHTENTPYALGNFRKVSTNNICKNYSKTNVENILSKNYLANVIQRHFDPERVVEEFSDTSHFTSPVCRDFPGGHGPFESDVCSCCHGQFQNVDKYMNKNENFIIEQIKPHRLNKSIYYDSNHYDIIPVKEKSFKVIKEEKLSTKEKLSKKERQVPMKCWPEDPRSKPCYQFAVHNNIKIPSKLKNHKRPKTCIQENKIYLRKKSPYHVQKDIVDHGIGPTDTSNSCCVDCSEVYTKPIFPAHINRKVESTQPKFRQNAECLTIDVSTNKLAITRSIQIDIDSTENKTEETLNQIKSMLQSVLAEVKTNPQVNNIQVEKPKKDAVIQNGPSQSNIQTCSSFLHSFTYNSYDANPYIPSCSRQSPSNFCYTNFPYQRMRCHQNFPLVLHPPGYRICGCLNKNSGHASKPNQRQAATTATNTEIGDAEDNAKETDKLIKEIYKSLALTMDLPKDTSNSEYDELKSTTMESTNKNDPKRVRSTIVAISRIQKRDKQIEASMTPLSMTTVQSKDNNSSVGTISDTNKTEGNHYTPYESQTTDLIPEEEVIDGPKAKVALTISEHDSEDLSSNDDEDEIIEENADFKETEKTEKRGLLRRMLGSVKIFNKRNQIKVKAKQVIKDETDDDQSLSDSDDYETIYSEKSNIKSHPMKRQLNKPGIYQTYRPSKQGIRINRKSPYMEQEYRRQWEENLIFQENRGRRYSSERPFSVQKTPLISPYWKNYEARSAIVDNTPYCRRTYSPIRNTVHKVEKRTSTINFADKVDRAKSKISWLKKHKLGIHCGEQWKKFILEN